MASVDGDLRRDVDRGACHRRGRANLSRLPRCRARRRADRQPAGTAWINGPDIDDIAGLKGEPLVIFVSGQSNAARRIPSPGRRPRTSGRGPYAGSALSDAAATTTIGTFQTGAALNGTANWGIMIGARAAIDHPDRPVFVINISKGGLSIDQWGRDGGEPEHVDGPSSTNMDAAFAEIATITGKTVNRIDGMFWWQGKATSPRLRPMPTG
jgi:hypothetical protein